MTAEKTDNKLIEAFYISQGGKPHLQEDIWFYESDWNMIMALVKQIHKLNDESGNELIAKYDEVSHDVDIFRLGIAAPKSVVYKGVVEFIKWYKQQSK